MITDARIEHAGAPRWSATLPYWVAIAARPRRTGRSTAGIRWLLARLLRRASAAG